MFKKFFKSFNLTPLELILTILVLSFVGYIHSQNMFRFPLYENDEGIYMSQAWAVSKLNQLSPYVYWYDHSPFGWIFLSIIANVIGGYNAFGNAINTGRVIMFLFHMTVSIVLICYSKIFTKKVYAGLAAVLLFGTLPTAVFFHRRVLLDNILVFFLSLSIIPIIREKISNKGLIISGILLAFAILSKESGIVFLPVFILFLWFKIDKSRRIMSQILFLGSTLSLLLMYPMMALLKTELLPSSDKTSLIGTLGFQSSRGTGLPFWNPKSDFLAAMTNVYKSSAVSVELMGIYLALFTLGTILLYRLKFFYHKELLFFSSLLGAYIIFCIRGKLFLDFYIIPFFFLISALSIFFFDYFKNIYTTKYKFIAIPVTTALTIILCLNAFNLNYKTLNYDEVEPSQKALSWINNNVGTNNYIISDYGILMDLKDGLNTKYYLNADNFWKADFEREIRSYKLKDNPFNIDYLYVSNQMYSDMMAGSVPFTTIAYHNSKPIVSFKKDGIKADIYKVVKDKNPVLINTWESLKADPSFTNPSITDNLIHRLSLGSLLNDQEDYNKTLETISQKLYQQDQYQTLSNDSLLRIIESGINMRQRGQEVGQIYKQTINYLLDVRVKNITDLKANSKHSFLYEGEIKKEDGGIITKLDFSYFKPNLFSKIAKFYPDNRWGELKQDGYFLLDKMLDINPKIQSIYLFDSIDNTLKVLNEEDSKLFNINVNNTSKANLVYYEVFLDYKETRSKEIERITSKSLDFYTKLYESNGFIPVQYDAFGKTTNYSKNLSNTTGIYGLFKIHKNKNVGKIWQSEYINEIEYDQSLKDFTVFSANASIEDRYWGSLALVNDNAD
jgi:4-amino-4-deoxy-L-arabinose transferase-like glycosyltransferase